MKFSPGHLEVSPSKSNLRQTCLSYWLWIWLETVKTSQIPAASGCEQKRPKFWDKNIQSQQFFNFKTWFILDEGETVYQDFMEGNLKSPNVVVSFPKT